MDKFFEITIGNVISWTAMILGGVAYWVRQSNKLDYTDAKIDRIEKEFVSRFDKQDKTLEEIKVTGSPSSRTAIMVLNSRLEGQGQRVAELEKIAASIARMETNIEWMMREMERSGKLHPE